ncbi:secreted protein, partial [Streptomyces coelicoflavus ZG0656]
VSVSCGPTGGSAPPSLDATSAAFEEGTVALRKVADGGGTASGPTYRGTARIAAAGAPDADPEDAGDAGDAEALGDAADAADAWT